MGAFLDESKHFHALWDELNTKGRNGPPLQPRCVLLGDGDAPKSCLRCVFVSFSPFKNNFHNYIKDAQPACLTLPVPLRAEMMDTVSQCYPELLERAERRINVVGPWPRLLQQDEEPTEDWIRAQIGMSTEAIHRVKSSALTELDADFSHVRVSELIVGLRLDNEGEVAGAEDYAKRPRWFWNDVPRIIELVYENLRQLDNSVARQILSWEGHRLFHALVGGMFECSAYVHIWNGSKFQVKEALKAYARKGPANERKVSSTSLAQDLAPLTMKKTLLELEHMDADTKRGHLVVPLVENFAVRAAATALPLPRCCLPALLLPLSEQFIPHPTVPCCLPAVTSLLLAPSRRSSTALAPSTASLRCCRSRSASRRRSTRTRSSARSRTSARPTISSARTPSRLSTWSRRDSMMTWQSRRCPRSAPTFEGISGSAKWNAFVGELNVTFYLAYSEAAAGGGAARTGNRERLRSGEHVS
jgi:hypothetical protein